MGKALGLRRPKRAIWTRPRSRKLRVATLKEDQIEQLMQQAIRRSPRAGAPRRRAKDTSE